MAELAYASVSKTLATKLRRVRPQGVVEAFPPKDGFVLWRSGRVRQRLVAEILDSYNIAGVAELAYASVSKTDPRKGL